MNKKVLSKAVSQLDKAKAPAKPKDIITDPMGQWKFLGQDTRIPGNGKGDTLKITMKGVPVPVFAQPNVGPGVMMESGKDYEFPDAYYVDESPQMKKGGILKLPKMPKPSKKGVLSKAYSNSLDATNKLFTQHKLFEKVKSKKGKVFDPNANYQLGGFSTELHASPDMGAVVNPALNYNKGNFNINASSDIPIEDLKNYFKNLNVNATYKKNLKKYGNLGLSGSGRFSEENDPEYNVGVNYNKQFKNGLGININANSPLKDIKNNANANVGLTYNFQDGGEYIETDLTDDEIEELRKGGYIVQDISVPSVGDYKQGGALLTKKVTCKKCGWKWDAADGGDDITTCHKCGDQGLVHAQKGVQVNKKGTRNPALEEYMNRDMSQAYQIKNIPSDNTKVVKPVIKTSKPKPVLANRNEQKALAQHLVNTGAASRYLGDNYDGSKTLNEAMLEKVQQNPNIMNSIDKQEYQYLIDKEQKAYDKASPLEKTASFIHSAIADPMLVGSNLIEGKAPMLWQGMNMRADSNPETQSFYKQASGANNNSLNKLANYVNPGSYGTQASIEADKGNYGTAALNLAAGVALPFAATSGAAMSAVKGIGSAAIPGMASVPGATVGNLVNSGFIANSLYHAPGNVKEWYDVSQGKKDWKDAAMGTVEVGLGLVGSGAGAKTALQEVEKLGLKNVVKGKASIKDVFKRDDLVNINTADDLASYEKALESGTVSPTRNRFYSSSKNPDLLNYAKGEENVFVHRVPQTKAASAGKSLATVKPKGAALTARERSIPTSADVESLISSGKLSGHSEETIQGLKEVAANPEGYWNLPTFQNNAELQALVKDPNLVNPAEHFLPRPDVSNFELMPISAIASSAPKLINTDKITNAALTGLKEESIGNHLIKHESVDNMKNEHKLGGNTNNYIELDLTPEEIEWYRKGGYVVEDIV